MKAVAQLRQMFPAGRIVHELQLEQFGVRIDIACVSPDNIVVVEVKSEKDVLTRLAKQVNVACSVADEVWIVIADRHATKARPLWEYPRAEQFPDEDALAAAREIYHQLAHVRVFSEAPLSPRIIDIRPMRWWQPNLVNPRARWEMLRSAEMRDAIGLFFGGATIPGAAAKLTRRRMTREALEHMNGREIRRSVCAQLRERTFMRADPPTPIPRIDHDAEQGRLL